MNLVIVNSGVGNVRSVANMLRRVGVEAVISDRVPDIEVADAIILPGVGSFDSAVRRFRATGLANALDDKARRGETPMLGICLGMQLMGERSEEGQDPGFGWIGGKLKKFKPSDGGADTIRVPHMGWNLVAIQADDPLFAGFEQPPRFYFDHSYYFATREPRARTGITRHGVEFAASIRQGLLFGVQFHPEKSHRFGLQLMRNFASFAMSHTRQHKVPA